MAVYHLKVGFGSRAGGQSARAKNEYIEREGRYAEDREEREHVEHGHMPAWAQDDPHAYWQAADAHERANGRLYSEIQFALPHELDASGRRELAGAFAAQVCGVERLPYTLALHKGESTRPDKEDNPHAHLMFSERGNDGIARSEEQWFKRHNPTAPERGGARKSRAAKAGDWLDTTRQAWEQTANRALAQAGRAERIDGRSLPDRRDAAHREGDLERAAELSREPNVHRGPGQYLKDRGRAAATVAQAKAVEQRTATARAERDAAVGRWSGWSRRSPRSWRGCRRPMTEFEERLTHEYSKLAEQYAQEQKELSAQVESLGKAGAAVGRAIRAGAESAHRVGEYARGATTTTGRTCHDLDRRLRLAFGERQQNDRRLQRCYEGVERTFSMIHPEAEQKRKDGDRPDRVEGLIESRIQNRIRSRSYDFDR